MQDWIDTEQPFGVFVITSLLLHAILLVAFPRLVPQATADLGLAQTQGVLRVYAIERFVPEVREQGNIRPVDNPEPKSEAVVEPAPVSLDTSQLTPVTPKRRPKPAAQRPPIPKPAKRRVGSVSAASTPLPQQERPETASRGNRAGLSEDKGYRLIGNEAGPKIPIEEGAEKDDEQQVADAAGQNSGDEERPLTADGEAESQAPTEEVASLPGVPTPAADQPPPPPAPPTAGAMMKRGYHGYIPKRAQNLHFTGRIPVVVRVGPDGSIVTVESITLPANAPPGLEDWVHDALVRYYQFQPAEKPYRIAFAMVFTEELMIKNELLDRPIEFVEDTSKDLLEVGVQ